MGARDHAVHHQLRASRKKLAPEIRKILMRLPRGHDGRRRAGRPDDGTDPTGFFNCEFYVGPQALRRVAGPTIHSKAELIAAIQNKLDRFPGIIFNFTQPAEDAVDEASTGLKSSLAVKVFGPNLKELEKLAEQDQAHHREGPGISNITIVRELGQPSLDVKIDRQKVARYGLDVATIDSLIEAAVGGVPATPA